jgi:hypothetical protein
MGATSLCLGKEKQSRFSPGRTPTLRVGALRFSKQAARRPNSLRSDRAPLGPPPFAMLGALYGSVR